MHMHHTLDRYYVHIAKHGSLTSWRRRSEGGKREREIRRRGKAKKEEGEWKGMGSGKWEGKETGRGTGWGTGWGWIQW
jgi:hypothetical protein